MNRLKSGRGQPHSRTLREVDVALCMSVGFDLSCDRAAWFERTASAAIVRSIYRFKTDNLELDDEYEPHPTGESVEKRQRAAALHDASRSS